MQGEPIPLIILGGSDRRPAELPDSGRDHHPLVGYKGVDVRVDGRPLVSALVDRLERCGAFAPIVIAGPRAVYEGAGVPTRVIDTDGSFGDNIRAGIEALRAEHPHRSLAMTTIDILPELSELQALLADYRANGRYDFWYPLILVPEDSARLGAFAWKPKYRVVPEPGKPAASVLPGHLAIFDPEALRLDFLYRLMHVGYRSRNKPIAYRRGYIIRQAVWRLVAQDLRYLLGLRVPNLTWSVVSSAVAAARRLRAGTITRAELEQAVRRIFVKTKHRRRFRDRRVSLPLLHGLSLAEDIDTVEEARARGATGTNASSS